MAINNATLYTDAWSEIKNIIVAASPYITANGSSDTTVASVEVSYNEKQAARPQVVISPIEKSEDTYKFGAARGRMLINVIIDCYGSKSLYADQLMQQVDNALAESVPEELDLVGTTSNSGFQVLSGNTKVFGQSMTFTYIKE